MTRKQIDKISKEMLNLVNEPINSWEDRRPALIFELLEQSQVKGIQQIIVDHIPDDGFMVRKHLRFKFYVSNTAFHLPLRCTEEDYNTAVSNLNKINAKPKKSELKEAPKIWDKLTPKQRSFLGMGSRP